MSVTQLYAKSMFFLEAANYMNQFRFLDNYEN